MLTVCMLTALGEACWEKETIKKDMQIAVTNTRSAGPKKYLAETSRSAHKVE